MNWQELFAGKWPNWVDLVVVIVLLRTCYSGFGRGFLTELLNLAGVISVTAITVNYWHTLTKRLQPWLWIDPAYAPLVVFWLIFLTMALGLRWVLARVGDVIKWERLHWTIQGLGLILGGLRGLWWAGFILIVLTASGFAYLRDSVEARSVLGPRLVEIARGSMGRIADRFPGASGRGEAFVPVMKRSAAPPSKTPSPGRSSLAP